MAELLNWAQSERRSGALVVRRSQREKRIYLRDGQIAGCLTDDPAEYFGQHLLLGGYLHRDDLFRCLTLCKMEGKRLGEVLVEQGLLERRMIQERLREQVADRVCDLFLWRHGVFYFESELPPEGEDLDEPIEPIALLLEGARWIDERERIYEVFKHDAVVLGRGAKPSREDLSPLQERIVGETDGKLNLEQIYDKVRGSHFRFLKATFELERKGVLVIVDSGAAASTASVELPIYDLLLEQAAEEHILLSRHHFAIPMEVLGDYVPIWVRDIEHDSSPEMPLELRDFYRQIDGRSRLRDLFSPGSRERNREAEMLVLQMRRGALALLPAPFEELEAGAEERGAPEKGRWWRRLFGRAGGTS